MLTLKKIVSRPVVVKLNRPIKAKIATIEDWPIVVIDLYTNEGIVGTSYLQPYLIKSLKYIITMIDDFNEVLKNKTLSPYDNYEELRKSLHFVSYEGLSIIAVSGVDMAIWDAMAKAANMPFILVEDGYTDKNPDEIYHNYLVKDFINLEKLVLPYIN